jgi:hypothetical protein
MIINCHCHAGKGDILTAPWNTTAPIEPYLRRARAAGIDRTVIFAPFDGDYAQANAEVARIVARHPNRLIGFAFVRAARDAGRVFEMINVASSTPATCTNEINNILVRRTADLATKAACVATVAPLSAISTSHATGQKSYPSVLLPDAVTARTLRRAEKGKDLVRFKSADDLFR